MSSARILIEKKNNCSKIGDINFLFRRWYPGTQLVRITISGSNNTVLVNKLLLNVDSLVTLINEKKAGTNTLHEKSAAVFSNKGIQVIKNNKCDILMLSNPKSMLGMHKDFQYGSSHHKHVAIENASGKTVNFFATHNGNPKNLVFSDEDGTIKKQSMDLISKNYDIVGNNKSQFINKLGHPDLDKIYGALFKAGVTNLEKNVFFQNGGTELVKFIYKIQIGDYKEVVHYNMPNTGDYSYNVLAAGDLSLDICVAYAEAEANKGYNKYLIHEFKITKPPNLIQNESDIIRKHFTEKGLRVPSINATLKLDRGQVVSTQNSEKIREEVAKVFRDPITTVNDITSTHNRYMTKEALAHKLKSAFVNNGVKVDDVQVKDENKESVIMDTPIDPLD